MTSFNIPPEVFAAYENLGVVNKIVSLDHGLINRTFRLESDQKMYILQEVSPIFDDGIHVDSMAVCCHLAQHNMPAPNIYLTRLGEPFVRVFGRVFRVLNYLDGYSVNQISSLTMAQEAGRILGLFHLNLADFSYQYQSQRRHKGDYLFHSENLVMALKNHREHSFYQQVKPLADLMLSELAELGRSLTTTPRHVHGDPKISNILFGPKETAICLIDFDTLSQSGWSLEMADALRSWANPHEEDVPDARVDLNIAEAALRGYALHMGGRLSDHELIELVIHSQAVSLCLAIRYATDVLNECYFSFARHRFQRAAEHNWLRANAMYRLYQDFAEKKLILSQLVGDLLKKSA